MNDAADPTDPTAAPNRFRTEIEALRERLRGWLFVGGAARFVLATVGVLAILFVLDFFLEPDRPVRGVLLAGALAALAYAMWRWIVAPLRTPLGDSALALAVERRIPALGDRLITAVELSAHAEAPALLARVRQEAGERLGSASLTSLLQLGPTWRWTLAGVAALATAIGLAAAFPAPASVFAARLGTLAAVRYPRQTTIVLEGFTEGVRKTAKGRDATLTAIVSGPSGRAAVEIRGGRGRRQRHSLTAQANGKFEHVLRAVFEPVEVRVYAGDEVTPWHRLEPIPPPTVAKATLLPTYPEYTELSPRPISWQGGALSLPVGTAAELTLEFSKPVKRVDLVGLPTFAMERPTPESASIRFECVRSATLRVKLTDEDGVDSGDPIPFDVAAVVDEPPTFDRFEPLHIGPAVTRMAVAPFELRLSDDYGVEQLWFRFEKSGGPAQRIPLADELDRTVSGTPALELADFNLKPGDRIALALEASDLPPLDPPTAARWQTHWDARLVRSPSFAFEVVPADELLARLAARELNGRYRFEQTLRECRDARKTVADLAKDSAGGTPGKRLRLDEALAVVRKGVGETQELAATFRAIVAEMRNNRCAASTTVERLEVGVARPLEGLVRSEFAAAQRSTAAALDAYPGDKFPAAAPAALADLDRLLAQGDTIVQSMLKMENFNELVAALRSVRDEQQKLLEKTAEERKKRILDLVK